MLGCAAGPEPHVQFGGAAHPGRLFLVIAGEDRRRGGRGPALGVLEQLFRDADPDWLESRILAEAVGALR